MRPKFEQVKRGGYDMEQVDKYINHIRSEYNNIAAAYKEVHAKFLALEDEKNDIAKAMTSAHTYEKNMKKAVDEQALKLIEQAQAQAEKIMADAQETAQKQAQKIITNAQTVVRQTHQPQVQPQMPLPAHTPVPSNNITADQSSENLAKTNEWIKRIEKTLAPTKTGGEVEHGTNENTIHVAGANQNAGAIGRRISDTDRHTPKLSARRHATNPA